MRSEATEVVVGNSVSLPRGVPLSSTSAPSAASPSGGQGAVRVIDLDEAQREIERRSTNPDARLSWASGTPFVLVGSEEADASAVAARAEQRRAARSLPLLRRIAATDVLIAFCVMAVCLYSLPRTRPWTVLLAAVLTVTWVGAVAALGGYDRRRVGDGPDEFSSIVKAAVVVVALVGVIAFSFELIVPRRDVLVAVPLIAGTTVLSRYAWRQWLHARRRRGVGVVRTLVVGESSAAEPVVADLRRESHHGLQVVGACVPADVCPTGDVAGAPVLGVVSEVPQVVVDHDIDNVLVVGAQLTGQPLRRLSWALEQTGAALMVAPGLVEVTGPYVSIHPAAGLSLLQLERPTQRSGRLLAKAVLDRLLGIAIFVAAVPLIAVAALAVRLTSKGPAFFPQERVGQDGTVFRMWKLRSMVIDADDRVSDLAAQNEGNGLLFKMRRDPRVTPVGSVLRRLSLDELPQLWNVVRGDMSLVGPRPPLPREYALYHDHVHRRLRVKPGLTGLWQVNGRSDLSWEESVRLDLRYVDNWSPAMDLQILWKTIRAVVSGAGAY